MNLCTYFEFSKPIKIPEVVSEDYNKVLVDLSENLFEQFTLPSRILDIKTDRPFVPLSFSDQNDKICGELYWNNLSKKIDFSGSVIRCADIIASSTFFSDYYRGITNPLSFLEIHLLFKNKNITCLKIEYSRKRKKFIKSVYKSEYFSNYAKNFITEVLNIINNPTTKKLITN